MFLRRSFFTGITILLLGIGVSGCTSIVTAPISVASSVVEAGFGVVGAAGGAVVDTVTGGGSDEE